MEDLTATINRNNVNSVREQINRKKQSRPFLATINDAAQTITDYDTFPYPRWFRGVPESSQPIVAEREAGWRTRYDDCYSVERPLIPEPYPDHCFEAACSIVYPCRPKFFQKYADREAIEIAINDACLIRNR
jgi:hypothetical protein